MWLALYEASSHISGVAAEQLAQEHCVSGFISGPNSGKDSALIHPWNGEKGRTEASIHYRAGIGNLTAVGIYLNNMGEVKAQCDLTPDLNLQLPY